MNPIEAILTRFPIMILDGAFATELEKRGCNLNDQLWSAKILFENPKLIQAVHEDYLVAGADCVITASYQATFEGFAARGLSESEAAALITRSVTIARQARDRFWTGCSVDNNRPRPLVAASVGPYGAFLADGSEYRGNYMLSEEQLMDFHRRRLQVLIAAEPDLLACETLPCLSEARALVRLLADSPGISAWISFTAKDGQHTCNGDRIRDCAAWLNDFDQVAAIGINCTAPRYVSELIKEISSETDKPIIVYPNSGERYDPLLKQWRPGDSGDFAAMAKQWLTDGARIIGGCCRTEPKDIRAICELVR